MEKPNIRENIGKALLDVAKLTFASFILQQFSIYLFSAIMEHGQGTTTSTFGSV